MLINNKRALFEYEIVKKFEAGIELRGFEVKAIKNSMGSLKGSYVIIRGGEAFLTNAHIPPYQPANTPESYDPYRARKLLLSKKEIAELAQAEDQKNLTIAPISMYNKGRHIKIEIAIARGKKRTDKRQTIKERETDIDIQRTLKYE